MRFGDNPCHQAHVIGGVHGLAGTNPGHRRAATVPKTDEDGRTADVSHRYRSHDVPELGAIDRFQAKPRDRSKRTFLIVTVLKPLVPSVPNLTCRWASSRWRQLLHRIDAIENRTGVVAADGAIFDQHVCVAKNTPRPNDDFKTIASSVSELKTELRTLRFWTLSMSIASRLVSTMMPSSSADHASPDDREMAAVLDRKIAETMFVALLSAIALLAPAAVPEAVLVETSPGSFPERTLVTTPLALESLRRSGLVGDHDVGDPGAVDQAVGPVAVALVLESDEEVHLRRVINPVLVGTRSLHRAG